MTSGTLRGGGKGLFKRKEKRIKKRKWAYFWKEEKEEIGETQKRFVPIPKQSSPLRQT